MSDDTVQVTISAAVLREAHDVLAQFGIEGLSDRKAIESLIVAQKKEVEEMRAALAKKLGLSR